MSINVFANTEKDFFRCAKDSVFGDGAFLTGVDYAELQEILNAKIRTNPHLIRWADSAPPHVQTIDILSGESYARRCQKHLKLTGMGEGRLQVVLTKHYGTMRKPSSS